jgi:hypothetical protein
VKITEFITEASEKLDLTEKQSRDLEELITIFRDEVCQDQKEICWQHSWDSEKGYNQSVMLAPTVGHKYA